MDFHRSFVEFSIRRGGAEAAPAATAAGAGWSPFVPHQADKIFPRRKQKTLKKCKNIFFVHARIDLLLFLQFGKNGCTGIKFQCSNLAINILRSSKRTRKTIVLFRNTTKTLRHWQQNSPPSTDKTASVKSGRHTSQPPEKSPTQGTDNRERPHQTP